MSRASILLVKHLPEHCLPLCLASGVCFRFPHQNLHVLLFSPMRSTCPTHPMFLDRWQWWYSVTNSNLEAPRYVVFSRLLLCASLSPDLSYTYGTEIHNMSQTGQLVQCTLHVQSSDVHILGENTNISNKQCINHIQKGVWHLMITHTHNQVYMYACLVSGMRRFRKCDNVSTCANDTNFIHKVVTRT